MSQDQGERVAALRQGLNINPLALSGQTGAKAPPVRPYASGGGVEGGIGGYPIAPPTPTPTAETTSAPPPRPPKPRGDRSTAPLSSPSDEQVNHAVLYNPYDSSTSTSTSTSPYQQSGSTSNRSNRNSVSVLALGPIPTLPSLETMLASDQPLPPSSPYIDQDHSDNNNNNNNSSNNNSNLLSLKPVRPPRKPSLPVSGDSSSSLSTSPSSLSSSPSSLSSSPSSSSSSSFSSLPSTSSSNEGLIVSHPTRDRVLGTSLAAKRLPTNKNQELRDLRAQVQLLQGTSPGASAPIAISPSSSSGGDSVVISSAQLAELKKERDNFRLVAKKLQEESQKNKQQLEELKRASLSAPPPPTASLSNSEIAAKLREMEEQLRNRDATIARLRSENARRESELLQADPAELQNPQLERERLARQREELDQMKAEEAKAEVAKLRSQVVQLKRAMERKVGQLESSLEEETRNSVNLLAEKRRLEEQIRNYHSPQTSSKYSSRTLSSAPGLLDDDEGFPEPDLRRAKADLYSSNPSSQYADVPLLSAADFSNPPPMRPKSQAKISPSKPADMCSSCIIS